MDGARRLDRLSCRLEFAERRSSASVERSEGREPTSCPFDHVGEREGVEVVTHVLSDLGPHGQQNALALVVARPVLVGLTEVARHDGTVDGTHDLAEGDLIGQSGEHIAAPDASLGADEACSLQCQQDLLEVGLGKARSFGDIAY